MKQNRHQQGSISIFVLTIGVILSTTIGGLVIFGMTEYTSSQRSEAHEQSLTIAEAGMYYYRWHLAHAPTDYQDGTNQAGPYVHEFHDPEGGVHGSYSLEITPPSQGSSIVTIRSTGWTSTFPNIRRTITARFGPEPLTRYSFLHNANVWFGQGLTVFGEIFSNGGIRFDGINESVVKSSRATYTCGSETGCSPSRTRPGVWGTGGPSDLWEYPVPVFDFDSIITDFNAMRTAAQASGVYRGASGSYGYRVQLNSNGTYQVYRVTSAANRAGWSVENGCSTLYQHISSQQLLGTYNVSERRIAYFEDTVWVEGTVNGHLTIVAARLPSSTYTTNMWIKDNVRYNTQDGSTSLGLIAQNDIYFARDIPDDFTIHGALLAQNGKIIRHNYRNSGCSSVSQAVRNSLTIYGSVISNQKSYWNFNSGSSLISGFETRDITYNQQSADIPPPYFPSTDIYRILDWKEE